MPSILRAIDELSGYWDKLNRPYIEVEDTAVAVLRLQWGAIFIAGLTAIQW